MSVANCKLSVDKSQPETKWCFLWCVGPLTQSLARCLWKALAYLWGSAENGEKTVSLPLWILSCGCEHCLPNLSLCGWGVGTLRERTSLLTPCGLMHPEPLPAPCLLERESLSRNKDCPCTSQSASGILSRVCFWLSEVQVIYCFR